MATFRKVHVSFWADPYIQSLSPEQKYFYLYLLTNERTRQCGIYEITKKQISYDTGYNIDTVSILLKYFISCKKILYSEATSELAIKNWRKFNDNTSPKVQVLVNQEIKLIKDKSLIQYLYSTDTVSIQNPQKEEEVEQEEESKKINAVGFQPPAPPDFSDLKLELGNSEFYRPLASEFNGLPKSYTVNFIRLVKATKMVDIEPERVTELWEIFKERNLKGTKVYIDEHSVYEHFLNSNTKMTFKPQSAPKKTSKPEGKKQEKIFGVEFINDYTQCRMSDDTIQNLTVNQQDSARYNAINPKSISKT